MAREEIVGDVRDKRWALRASYQKCARAQASARCTGRGLLTRREAKSVGEFALALFEPTTELTEAGPPARLDRFRAPRFIPR